MPLLQTLLPRLLALLGAWMSDRLISLVSRSLRSPGWWGVAPTNDTYDDGGDATWTLGTLIMPTYTRTNKHRSTITVCSRNSVATRKVSVLANHAQHRSFDWPIYGVILTESVIGEPQLNPFKRGSPNRSEPNWTCSERWFSSVNSGVNMADAMLWE